MTRHRAGPRVGHDARGRGRVRPRSAASRCRSPRPSPYSTDENLWGRSIECGVLEDPWVEPPDDVYHADGRPGDVPGRAGLRRDRVRAGVPTAVNGVAMPFIDIIAQRRHHRRRARRRPHRHGREPARRHQVARDLRGAGRRRAPPGAPRNSRGFVSPRDLDRVKQELAAQVRRHGLQRRSGTRRCARRSTRSWPRCRNA